MTMKCVGFATCFFLMVVLCSAAAHAANGTPFVENFDDGENDFDFIYTGQITSNGQFTGTSSTVNNDGDIELQHQCFAKSVANDVTGSAVQSSSFLQIPNVPGSNFEMSVDFSVVTLSKGGAKDDSTSDRSATVALGALGGKNSDPSSFNGFVETASWAYYIAVFSVLKEGDNLDPRAPTVEGAIRLIEYGFGGDGQVNAESGKVVLPKTGASTLALRGVYSEAGTLTLTASVTAGGLKTEVSDSDTTPIPGEWFGVRTAAWARSDNNPQTTINFNVNFDNFGILLETQADALIGKKANSLLGDNIVNQSGKGQTQKSKVTAGDIAQFVLRFQNDGTLLDGIDVRGPAGGNGYSVQYFDGNTDITSQMTGSGYSIASITPGSSKTLKMDVETSAGLDAGDSRSFKVIAESASNADARDTVKAKVTIR